VAATRGHQLVALDPEGGLRWALSRPAPPRLPRWAPDGLHIAYLSGGALRIVEGDGAPDRPAARSVAAVAPAWRAGAQPLLAFAERSGRIAALDVAARRILWSVSSHGRPRLLAWSADGRTLAAVTATRVLLYR